MSHYTVTTAIPYVNGSPHVGHALELVQTDVLARHRRQRGDEVRFQTGTDDNALKNVQGAEAEVIPQPSTSTESPSVFLLYATPLTCRLTILSGPAQITATNPV